MEFLPCFHSSWVLLTLDWATYYTASSGPLFPRFPREGINPMNGSVLCLLSNSPPNYHQMSIHAAFASCEKEWSSLEYGYSVSSPHILWTMFGAVHIVGIRETHHSCCHESNAWLLCRVCIPWKRMKTFSGQEKDCGHCAQSGSFYMVGIKWLPKRLQMIQKIIVKLKMNRGPIRFPSGKDW